MNEVYKYVESVFAPTPVYLVGGSVRDHILGRQCKDYDFCVMLHPDEIVSTIKKAGRHAYLIGQRFGTIGFKTPDGQHYIEVTSTRGEEYTEGSRHPVTVFGVSLSDDLSRRDFTMNALAYRKGKIIDPFGGREDIATGTIKAVGNPTIRFKEDPLRMLRACRFAAQFDMFVEPATVKSMRKNAHKILHVSKERWVQELDKLLMAESPLYGLVHLAGTGLMRYVLPEIALQENYDQKSRYHGLDLWDHTIRVVCDTPPDLNLRWAALLHDVAKPFCRVDKTDRAIYPLHDILGAEMVDGISRRLKFSNERREYLVHTVGYHLEDDSPLREYDNKHKRRVE